MVVPPMRLLVTRLARLDEPMAVSMPVSTLQIATGRSLTVDPSSARPVPCVPAPEMRATNATVLRSPPAGFISVAAPVTNVVSDSAGPVAELGAN